MQMIANGSPDILISECGPRDGLQILKQVMATADKLRWVDALYAAGLREIEVCSFVPPKLMPQMADAAAVVKHALTLPGLTVLTLVPNRRGAETALAAGAHKLTIPVSASEAHCSPTCTSRAHRWSRRCARSFNSATSVPRMC
jgi:hydroxymethylglutaryl-CoA lyase